MKRARVTKKQLLAEIMNLRRRLADPEGTVQRLLNERYSRDLRERELEHHADWDAEVVVHKMAAARWMRSCAAKVADEQGFFAIGAAIEALPLVPES
jgi:hypothetical protein